MARAAPVPLSLSLPARKSKISIRRSSLRLRVSSRRHSSQLHQPIAPLSRQPPRHSITMPSAKYIERPGGSRKSKGFIRSTYDSLTSSENASVVRSIAFFGVSVLPNPASDVRTPVLSGPFLPSLLQSACTNTCPHHRLPSPSSPALGARCSLCSYTPTFTSQSCWAPVFPNLTVDGSYRQ